MDGMQGEGRWGEGTFLLVLESDSLPLALVPDGIGSEPQLLASVFGKDYGAD